MELAQWLQHTCFKVVYLLYYRISRRSSPKDECDCKLVLFNSVSWEPTVASGVETAGVILRRLETIEIRARTTAKPDNESNDVALFWPKLKILWRRQSNGRGYGGQVSIIRHETHSGSLIVQSQCQHGCLVIWKGTLSSSHHMVVSVMVSSEVPQRNNRASVKQNNQFPVLSKTW